MIRRRTGPPSSGSKRDRSHSTMGSDSLMAATITSMVIAGFVGCGGEVGQKAQSMNDAAPPDASTAVSILPDSLPGSVSPCPNSWAHPNVCCTSGPSIGTVCTEHPDAPFRACNPSSLTFPDRRSCCALDGTGCVGAPEVATVDASAIYCAYPCGPGGYPPSEDPGGSEIPACTDVPSGSNCTWCCMSPGPGNCVIATGGCAEFESCSFDVPCGPCPSGWHVPNGIPDVCCRSRGTSVDCFSRANQVWPLTPS